jgi:hypothetical protein
MSIKLRIIELKSREVTKMDIGDLYSITGGNTVDGIEKTAKEEFLKVLRQHAVDENSIKKSVKDVLYEARLDAGAYSCHLYGFGENKINGKEPKEGFLELVEELRKGTQGEKLVVNGIVSEFGDEKGGWYITKKNG